MFLFTWFGLFEDLLTTATLTRLKQYGFSLSTFLGVAEATYLEITGFKRKHFVQGKLCDKVRGKFEETLKSLTVFL